MSSDKEGVSSNEEVKDDKYELSDLFKDQQTNESDRYLDRFIGYLDKELNNLCLLYEDPFPKNIQDFRDVRERISILIKTISELNILEQNDSYIGSGKI